MSSTADDVQDDSSPRIAIIGGGLGGLALAIGLLKHNIRVHIYEAAHAFSEIGAGVAFGPNSLRALHLIDERLLQGYLRHATFSENAERHNTWLSFRYGTDSRNGNGKKCGDLIMNLEEEDERYKAPGTKTRSCIHRARFLEELVALIPERIASFGKSLERTEEHVDGKLIMHFADGTTATADAIVGCDGIKSKVREAVCGGSVKPTFTGEYAYRAMVPRDIAIAVLGEELAFNGQLYCGYGGYIVTYPVEHGAFTNIVAVRYNTDSTWTQDQWTVPSTKEELLQDFSRWHPGIVQLLVDSPKHERWALFDLQHSGPYCKGRICLLGDSAHASTPHLGAGAGMAMEDAYILSHLIGATKSQSDIQKAFQGFDTIRRRRTQTLVEYSRLAGLACEFSNAEVGDDEDILRQYLTDRYRWIWREDLEAQLSSALEQLV